MNLLSRISNPSDYTDLSLSHTDEPGVQKKHDPASQCARILKVLKKHRRITNVQMINMNILRASERIRDLKRDGHLITSERVHGGVWEYRYQGHESDEGGEERKAQLDDAAHQAKWRIAQQTFATEIAASIAKAKQELVDAYATEMRSGYSEILTDEQIESSVAWLQGVADRQIRERR